MICNQCCELVRAAEPWSLQCNREVAVRSAWKRDGTRQRVNPPVPVVGAMVRDKVSLCMAYEEGGHHSALT